MKPNELEEYLWSLEGSVFDTSHRQTILSLVEMIKKRETFVLWDGTLDGINISKKDIQALLSNEQSTIDIEKLKVNKDIHALYQLLQAILFDT